MLMMGISGIRYGRLFHLMAGDEDSRSAQHPLHFVFLPHHVTGGELPLLLRLRFLFSWKVHGAFEALEDFRGEKSGGERRCKGAGREAFVEVWESLRGRNYRGIEPGTGHMSKVADSTPTEGIIRDLKASNATMTKGIQIATPKVPEMSRLTPNLRSYVTRPLRISSKVSPSALLETRQASRQTLELLSHENAEKAGN
jgi:hypothetical protein